MLSHSKNKHGVTTAEVTSENRHFDDIIKDAKYELLRLRSEEENHPLVKEWRLKKSEFIRKWAEALDGKISLHTWNKPRDWICTEIRRELRILGFNENEIDYVNQVLPKEFRRESLVRGRDVSPDFEEIATIGFKDIESMDSEELQQYIEQNSQVRQVNKDRAKTLNDNLEANESHAITVAEQKGYNLRLPREEKKETISTIKPEPNKCESYYAAVEVYNALQEGIQIDKDGKKVKYDDLWFKLQEKLREYPATPKNQPITEEDREVARFLRGKLSIMESETRMLLSFIDDKYAQSLWGWFKTLVAEESFGKHAAAVMTRIMPKCGKPELVSKKPRPLTRERVGDIKAKYWTYMKDFAESMEYYAWWAGVAKIWDDKYHNPYNADRRNKESPNLSETAFGANNKRN